MRISKVVGLSNAITGRNFAFARKLKESEKKDYTKAINDAFDYLGIQNRAMIIHGPSFPAKKEENKDLGIGSPYNNPEFIDFLKLNGFNGIQLGPTGKLNRGDTSPYSSSVFAKNPLFIDFSLLKGDKYASILSDGDIEALEHPIRQRKENYTRANYKEAEKSSDSLLKQAYNNYLDKVQNGNEDALRLKEEFNSFKAENDYWLEYYSVLDSIAQKYGTDYYPKWDSKDANLIREVKKNNFGAIDYYNKIKRENADEIERYKFSQFIIDKQSKEDESKRGNFTYISDLLVGVSSFDEMIFSDVFLKDWKIGARDGGVMNSPQLWNIPVVDPNKLFNRDGSLGPAGEFIKLKIQKSVQDASNIRIDHAFGLVDPFLYKPMTVHNKIAYDNGRRVEVPDSDRLMSGYLSELHLDRNKNFQKILPNIVIPALKESGIDPKKAVWEDLGYDATGLYNKVAREKLGLPGIDVLLWSRGENAKQNSWSYIGCHDNAPIRQGIESGEVMKQYPHAWNTYYLAGYLNPGDENEVEREIYRKEIEHSPKELFKAKFTELFRSTKNIQISFMDFFGINKRYNTPGTTGDDNWTLRLPSDWEDKYYKSLEGTGRNEGWAVNLPEILARAVKAKSEMDLAKYGEYLTPAQKWQRKLQADRIMDPLDEFSEILKEKSND